jgi:hypothetical protein
LKKHKLANIGLRVVNSIFNLIDSLPADLVNPNWRRIFPKDKLDKLDIQVRDKFALRTLVP